jgi:biopolymer transport protein ExbD
MASRRGISGRKGRRRKNRPFELQLTSMMDVLVIIVVFLLKSYNTSTNNLNTAPGLQLPLSSSPDSPTDSLQVIITPESMTVENQRILDFIQVASNAGSSEARYDFKKSDLDEETRRIIPLYDALMKSRERAELLLTKSKARLDGKPLPFEGILAVQADKKIKYETIRRVMYTAGAAGYKYVRFIAMKRDA